MDNNTFKYTYSAKQQKEIEYIRSKYVPRKEDKLETLRRLDKGVTLKANTVSIILGVIGALVMGGGMSLAMVWEHFVLGIAIGVIGMTLVALAYPVYKRVLEKERVRIAPEILRLTDELYK